MENGGVQVGSTVTSATGEYILDNTNVSDTIKYEHKYQIRVDMSQGSVKTKALVNIALGEKANIPDEPETAEKMRNSDGKWVQEILPPLGKKIVLSVKFR